MRYFVGEFKFCLELLYRWLREKWYGIIGIDRSFYCKSEIEGGRKCKYQCDHCNEYYKPLEEEWKKKNLKKNMV